MKIGLIGYGKMGKEIEKISIERNHLIVWKVNSSCPLSQVNISEADVLIEFTKPHLAIEHIQQSTDKNIPIVVGTTGWNDYLNEIKNEVIKKNASLLYASNFSIGVNVFFKINQLLSQLMSSQSEYKAGIEEIHHVQKLDSPSGTAISLANDILEFNDNYEAWKLGENEIPDVIDSQLPVVSYRVPDVPGTHTVIYESNIDSIKIVHEAKNRKGFALGAVLAAEWLLGKKGVFTMNDVLNIK
ncbi:MAG: 4-hydroxy-tetrahydrodipicolinate reductase [Flavobacteriia bacterium]|nr:4-hydroxy-tetrahydrodipicolinate reductase [Flavobacteriia bacterium]